MKTWRWLVLTGVLTLLSACEYKFYYTPSVTLSADSLVFSEAESQKIYLTITPAMYCEYQFINIPEWVSVTPESGYIFSDIVEILVTPDFSHINPTVLRSDLEVMTPNGNETILLIGYVGETTICGHPDTLFFNYFSASEIIQLSNNGNTTFQFSLSAADNYLEPETTEGSLEPGLALSIPVNILRENLESGLHYSELYLSYNGEKDTIVVLSESYFEAKHYLMEEVIDAEYDKNTDRLIYVSTASELVICDPGTGNEEGIALTYYPTCVSLSPDGSRAAVGHDGHVSLVDLVTKSVIRTGDISCSALDIVLAGNNFAYAFPKTGQWSDIHCLNMNTDDPVETLGTGSSIYAGTKAKLHPSGKYIYGADNGLSPSDLEKYNILGGTAAYMYDSPYHGDYAVSGDLWFSSDGKRIFTRGANVFKASESSDLDMTYNGHIPVETDDTYSSGRIMSLDHAGTTKKLVFIVSGDWSGPNRPYVYIHNSDNLTFEKKIELEKYFIENLDGTGELYNSNPRFVFTSSAGTTIFVLTRSDGSGLENDWALQSYVLD